MPITLDNDQVSRFIKEHVRQVLTAHAQLQDEWGVTVLPRFKMRFSAQIIAPAGLNAVPRTTVNATTGDKVTLSEEQPYTETTSRSSKQSGHNTEANETTSNDTQKTGVKEDGGQKTKANNREEGTTTTVGHEQTNTKTDSTNREETDSKEDQKSTQTQSQGTTSTTETNFVR